MRRIPSLPGCIGSDLSSLLLGKFFSPRLSAPKTAKASQSHGGQVLLFLNRLLDLSGRPLDN